MTEKTQPTDDAQQPVDQSAAESRVTQLMGPPQDIFASEIVEAKPAAAPPEPTVSMPPTAPMLPEEESVDINEINKNLAAQIGVSEPDLDMTANPDALTAPTSEAVSKDVADILQAPTQSQGKDPVSLATKPPVIMRTSIGEKIRQLWYMWWDRKILRYATIGLVLAIVAAFCFIRPLRTWALNSVGVRTKVSVTVIDESTQIPLKNVRLSVDGREVKTNDDGYAKLTDIRLGSNKVSVAKAGFANVDKELYLGMRITALGEVNLKPTGTQFSLRLVDYFSGKPIADVEVAGGDASTKSDTDGKALLTTQPGDDEPATVAISAKGFRTEKVSLPSDPKTVVTVVLVPSAKEVFVSRETGSYNLFKMDLDGKHKEILLKATGLESPDLQVLVDPSGQKVALVSTRDEQRNQDGYLLSALTIVDIASGDSETIEHSESVRLVGWSRTTLVYNMTAAGTSAANPARQKLMSYDYTSSKRLQLATANYFNGIILKNQTVYYAVSSTDPNVVGSLNRIDTDSLNKKTILTGTVWGLYRTDYLTLLTQTNDKWYRYKTGDIAASTTTPPSIYGSRQYLDAPSGSLSAWVDTRDSTGVLTVYDVRTNKDTELTKQRGLREVTRWVNDDVLIYRENNQGVVTEFAVSTEGGAAKELTEVSLTY